VSITQAIARLRRRPGVEWAVPDYIAHAAGVAPANTPGSSPFALDDPLLRSGAAAPAPFYPDDPGNTGTPGAGSACNGISTGRTGSTPRRRGRT